jgi:hypothetical protein
LDPTFFGLSTDYKLELTREIYVCTKHIGFSYSDVMMMPVWERRNYLEQFLKEVDYINKENEKAAKRR